MSSLYIAATGMLNQQANVDMISNNLANVNTSGFKKSSISFKELSYKDVITDKNQNNQIGLGSAITGIEKVFTQGPLQETGNPLDLAISGEGFFKIQLPDNSIAYSRDGSFRTDANGRLVTMNGYIVAPGITFPENFEAIMVAEDGTVSIKSGESETPVTVGVISLNRFKNPGGLKSIAGNLYQETTASGPAQDNPSDGSAGKIKQGFLETANVNIIEEMVNLIAAQRSYEINSKAIKASDEMMEMANSVRR
jgi:flagellar basal-body rod protein FlgG